MLTKREFMQQYDRTSLMQQLAPTATQPIGEGYCVKSGPAADALLDHKKEIEKIWTSMGKDIANIQDLQEQHNELVCEVNNLKKALANEVDDCDAQSHSLVGEVNNLIDRIKVLENAPSEAESRPKGLQCFDVWVVKSLSYNIGIYATYALALAARAREESLNDGIKVSVGRRSVITREQES